MLHLFACLTLALPQNRRAAACIWQPSSWPFLLVSACQKPLVIEAQPLLTEFSLLPQDMPWALPLEPWLQAILAGVPASSSSLWPWRHLPSCCPSYPTMPSGNIHTYLTAPLASPCSHTCFSHYQRAPHVCGGDGGRVYGHGDQQSQNTLLLARGMGLGHQPHLHALGAGLRCLLGCHCGCSKLWPLPAHSLGRGLGRVVFFVGVLTLCFVRRDCSTMKNLLASCLVLSLLPQELLVRCCFFCCVSLAC